MDDATGTVSIIIPANSEAGYIEHCLQAVVEQEGVAQPIHVVVAANSCSDNTVEIASSFANEFKKQGWELTVLDLPEPGKVNALNVAETKVSDGPRVFLDADVIIDKTLIAELASELATASPRYVTGTLRVKQPKSFITKHYAKCWQRLPFVKSGAVGAGLFSVNQSGRSRWGLFPDIISDDTFVRLNFTKDERIEVRANYEWPMIEGFQNLVRVRRRQDVGVQEIYERWPELAPNEAKASLGVKGHLSLLLKGPLDYLVYVGVQLVVKLGKKSGDWSRGR